MKKGSLKAILKKTTAFALAAMCALSFSNVQTVRAEGTEETSETALSAGTYEVPITSLVSAAPLTAVQTAFATAFGEEVVLEVAEDGSMEATVHCQNMQIDMGVIYYANVLTITGGTINSTKTEPSSLAFGSEETEELEVPDEITFPITLDDAGSATLEITVDFMNKFLGSGSDYPTNVTLTLDLASAELVTPADSNTEEITLTDGTYEVSVALYHATNDALSMAATCLTGSAKIVVKDQVAKMYLYTQPMTMMGITASIQELSVENVDGTYQAAVVKTTSEDGNPTAFAFTLPSTESFLNLMINPHIEAMHNSDIAARLFVDYTTLNKISDTPEEDSESEENSSTEDNEIENETEDKNSGDTENEAEDETDDTKSAGTEDVDLTTDGTYEVSVALYHATNNALSMASSSILEKAEIVVKDGVATMQIHTQPMTFGSITASLQELKIGDINNVYTDAVVTTRSADGNPTGFSFVLPHQGAYLTVKVNPHVAMMGNVDIDARIFVDYTTLTKVSDDTTGTTTSNTTESDSESESETTSGTTESVTGTETTTETATNTTADTAVVTTVAVTGTTGWNQVAALLLAAEEKGTITVILSETTIISGSTLELIKGQDKNVVFQLENGVKWTINGMNITGTDLADLDLGVALNTNVIPEDLVNGVASNGTGYIEISLNHDGEFGFTGTMTVTVGTQYAGQYANLYYYNESTGKMELMGSYLINENGEADLTFSHASDYVVVMDQDAYTVTAPQTGDETNVALPILFLLMGATVFGYAIRKKKIGK